MGGGVISVIASLGAATFYLFEGVSKLYDTIDIKSDSARSVFEKIYSLSNLELLGVLSSLSVTTLIFSIVFNGIAALLYEIFKHRRYIKKEMDSKIHISIPTETEKLEIDLTKPESLKIRLQDIERKLRR